MCYTMKPLSASHLSPCCPKDKITLCDKISSSDLLPGYISDAKTGSISGNRAIKPFPVFCGPCTRTRWHFVESLVMASQYIVLYSQ